MSFEQARSVSALLASNDVSPRWSRRACDALAALREDAIARETSTPTVTRNPDDEDLECRNKAAALLAAVPAARRMTAKRNS